MDLPVNMMHDFIKRWQLGTACLLLLLAGCSKTAAPSGSGGAPDGGGPVKVRLLTDWYPQPEHGGFYEALAKGYYRDVGLDVTILPGGPNIVAGRMVALGDVEFGMSNSDDIVLAVDRGLPLLAVGATMQHDPQGIMVRAESPVKTFADLANRRMAVASGAAWFAYLQRRFDLKGVQEVPMTFSVANFLQDPNYIQQVFITSEPFFARQGGAESRVLLIKDTGYDPYRVFFTRNDYARAHPDIVSKFVAASVRGWREYLRDPAPAHAEILQRNQEMSPERMGFSWQALRDGRFVDGDDASQIGRFDPARWQRQFDILKDLGLVTKPYDPDNIFSVKFAPAAP